jgi:phage baseplate assembly protein W
MPLERVSVGFKDLSMTFKQNPLNNDLIALKNENAIARSIRNIIFTYPGERFFNDNFGSKVSKLLFDNMDPLTAVDLRTQIISSIVNFEPRVELLEVTVNPNYQTNEFDTVIVYKIIGAEAAAQQLSFALQPTR